MTIVLFEIEDRRRATFEPRPPGADTARGHRDDVVVTPRPAFNTREAVRRILGTMRDHIGASLDGSPRNTVP